MIVLWAPVTGVPANTPSGVLMGSSSCPEDKILIDTTVRSCFAVIDTSSWLPHAMISMHFSHPSQSTSACDACVSYASLERGLSTQWLSSPSSRSPARLSNTYESAEFQVALKLSMSVLNIDARNVCWNACPIASRSTLCVTLTCTACLALNFCRCRAYRTTSLLSDVSQADCRVPVGRQEVP